MCGIGDHLLVLWYLNFRLFSISKCASCKYLFLGGRLAGTSQGPNLGQSLFDYIEKQHARSPLFFNFLYASDSENPVLRPQSLLPNLDVWDYYISEQLSHGPAYDLEVIQQDSQQEEENEAADGISSHSARKVVTLG